jgi:preprotein translocase subunit SecE
MARTTDRRLNEDEEEDLMNDEEEELEESSAPAISDSRRRRQMKRGEPISATETSDSPSVRKARATPSQREDEPRSGNFIIRAYQNLVDYFKDTRTELRKVAWPTREETLRLTYIVLTVTAIAAAFLGFVSFLFSLLTQAIASDDTSGVAGLFTMALVLVVTGLWLFRDRLFGNLE